jgi:pyruvate dehydrogenase E2 component (dihydrolipoamide acetyltransferase)
MQDEGWLAKIMVEVGGEEIKVGSVLAYSVEDKADIAAVAAEVGKGGGSGSAAPKAAPGQPPATEAVTPSTHQHSGEVLMMPSAHLMIEHDNIDPRSIKGTGRDGRITKGDVILAKKAGTVKILPATAKVSKVSVAAAPSAAAPSAAALPPSPSPSPPSSPVPAFTRPGGVHEDAKPSQMRKVIASRLTQSKANVPHYYTTMECEIDALLNFRKNLKNNHGVNISVNDLVIRAAGLALRDVPEANASLGPNDSIVESKSVDISVAVATDGGLITPIIKNVDHKGLSAIGSTVKEMAGRAKQGKLKPEEYQGGSFTISNLGMFGIKEFTAVINPPQSCILAVGGGVPKLVPFFDKEKNKLVPRKATSMSVSLSSDRRVVPDFIAGSSTYQSLLLSLIVFICLLSQR